ncbi:MAG: RNA polymerase sigma factor [Verrucomicrobiota bacterium]
MNGSELMAQYRAERSEAAFAQLVRGFGSLVYSVARRQLREAHLAEEVAQEVFTRLARSAPSFATNGELVAWLHRTSVHVAIDVWRAESRRQVREQKASMERVEEDDRGRWEEIGPHLDDAINQLSDLDRQAVLVRFFERKSMREVGAVLGVSEDAAKMRVSRALERLRSHFAAKGVAFGLTAGSELLLLHSVEAAPPPVLMRLEGLGGLASVQAGAGGMAGAILL